MKQQRFQTLMYVLVVSASLACAALQPPPVAAPEHNAAALAEFDWDSL
jgi:hypothetical protein